MKKIIRHIGNVMLRGLLAQGLLIGMCSAQQPQPQPAQAGETYVASVYGSYTSQVYKGNASTGSTSIVAAPVAVTLANSTVIVPFVANTPVTVDRNAANAETITPTVANCYAGSITCMLSTTFADTHANGEPIQSGTFGLQEAINAATTAGAGTVLIDNTWQGTGTALITTARGSINVVIQDNRSGSPVYYRWNGSAYVIIASSSQVCAESFLTNDVTHGGTDYGVAFNAADAYLQGLGTTAGVISFCSPGSHPVWTSLVESWPVALIDGSGSILIPQPGGANGVWGGSEITKPSCTITAGSNTVTCSDTTGLAANMVVGGIGLGDANRINGAPGTTTFTLAIPATLSVSGQTTLGSTQVCGLNTIRGLVNGQGISGTGIPAATTITAITAFSTTNGQCLTISNNATASSVQYVVGNTVNAPVALSISGSWTAGITAEAATPVLEIPYNASAPLNWASQNYTGKIQHLIIQDPTYRSLTGVRGLEVWGQDGFVSSDVAVYNIRGTCLTLGGFDSTKPLRESFFSDTKCVNDGDLPTGQSGIEVVSNGTSGSDEINQIKFSGGEVVYTHGEGITVSTYISSHQGNNGPRLMFFSDNFQVESGNADTNNPDIAIPADNVHVVTGNQIHFSGTELAVPGYGHALWRQDNVGSSNSYQANNSSLISAGNRINYTVTVQNGSANLTLPAGLSPTDNIFDGVGVQIGGVDYWFIPQNSVSGQTATLTQTYQGTSGTATMVVGAGGFFFFNTATAGVLDTRTSVGNIWTEMDSLAISLLGFGTPINVGIDQGSLPGRGENDNLGFEVYNTLGVENTLNVTGIASFPGGIFAKGVINSQLEGIFSNPNNFALAVSNLNASNGVTPPVQFTCPNLTSGGDCVMFLGEDSSTTGDSTILGWHNGATPFGWLGVFGANQLITWNSASVKTSVPQTAPGFFPQSVSAGPSAVYFNDFFTATDTLLGAIGSPAGDTCGSVQYISSTDQNHPGLLGISSGTGGTGTGAYCYITSSGWQQIVQPNGTLPWLYESEVYIPVLPGTTVGSYQVGTATTRTTSPHTDGLGFYLSSSNGVPNDWYCQNGSTNTDSGVAATVAFARLSMQSDGTNLHWYINGTQVCGTGTSLTLVPTTPQFLVWTSVAASATSVAMDVDYVNFQRQVVR